MTVENNQAGIVLGAIFGASKGVLSIITNMPSLTWHDVFYTGTLAFIGGVLGWCGSELMHFIKKKYKNWRK